MRDAFAVLFFVSVGMLFDPFLCSVARVGFGSVSIILLGKPLAALPSYWCCAIHCRWH